MNVAQLTVDRAEAQRLYRAYKTHAAYSKPIDWEVQRAYQLLSHGKMIIRALDAVVAAGVDDKSLPKLALMQATCPTCYLTRDLDGSCVMSGHSWRQRQSNTYRWRAQRFTFPADSFPWNWNRTHRTLRSEHRAQVPLVPVHLRPKRGLANYHILWEAEWAPEPPRDPYLLRRIGKADLWLVVAHWDLTAVERAALSTRVAL